MSRFLFLWLLLVLGNLLKNASRLVGCLTLLKESNNPERVSRHRLVQVGKLVLVRLRLQEKDLFTLLLRRGYVYCLTEAVTLEVAEKMYSMLHELMNRHESGLFGSTKPANQLVANVGKPVDGLKEVTGALVSLPLYNLHCSGIILQQRWSTWSGLCPESTDPRG
jgi:hypothetical protein